MPADATLPGGPANSLSEDVRSALAPILDPTERVTLVAAAVGCTLVLTDRQLLLVREGVRYRPKSGIRSWTLDRSLSVRPGLPRRTTGQLAIECGGRTTSVFYTGDHRTDMDQLVAEVRRRIYRQV